MTKTVVFGDVHGNLTALEAVIAGAGECDEWLCVGDIVGYGPRPNECVRRVASLSGASVSGNHDLGSIGKLDLRTFNDEAREACEWTGRVLDESLRTYLEELGMYNQSGDWLLVHGSPRDPVWEYVLTVRQASCNFPAFDCRICFHGHSHVPAVFRVRMEDGSSDPRSIELFMPGDGESFEIEEGWKFMVNVGSVGQPRDGDPRSCFVTYDTDNRTIEYHRAEYDIELVQEQMREAGLPEFLTERLSYGR